MWVIKLLIHFILNYIPYGEKINYFFQIIKGTHNLNRYKNLVSSEIYNFTNLQQYIKIEGKKILDIGTGWNMFNPLLFYILGAEEVKTVDIKRHVRFSLVKKIIISIEFNLQLISERIGIPIEVLRIRLLHIKMANNINELCSLANIYYLAPYEPQLTDIPDQNVDIIFSHSVFEHISLPKIINLITVSKRILKRDGICYHHISLHDHFAEFGVSSINFLKYSDGLWFFLTNNKFSYHNRLRQIEYIQLIENIGAKIIKVNSYTFKGALNDLLKIRINKKFSSFSSEDLAVSGTDIIFKF